MKKSSHSFDLISFHFNRSLQLTALIYTHTSVFFQIKSLKFEREQRN